MFRSFCLSGYVAALRQRNRLYNWINPPVIILLYHRVADLSSDPQQLGVSPVNFRDQIRFLKENYPILRLEDDWCEVTRPAVVVTFDDGYADNRHNALPILEELEVPATFFISMGDIGGTAEFWWDELERVILGDGDYAPNFTLHDGQSGRTWQTTTLDERMVLYWDLHSLMKTGNAFRRTEWLGQLREWARTGEEARQTHIVINHEELKQLAASAWVTVGAHGVTHTALSSLPSEQQRKEIWESKRALESLLGCKIDLFSYPFGTIYDYTRETVELCREAGFAKVAANFPGQVHRWTNPFLLPRHLVRNWSLDMFRLNLSSFWVA